MIKHFKTLLRGEVDALSLEKPGWRWFATYCLAIAVGSSVYGATIGLWRAPLQSVFTAIKFPLLIFLTCIGNGAVNGMLAQLFGSGNFDEFRDCSGDSRRAQPGHAFRSLQCAAAWIGKRDSRPQYNVADACLCHCLCRDHGKSAVARLAAKNDRARHHRPCRSI